MKFVHNIVKENIVKEGQARDEVVAVDKADEIAAAIEKAKQVHEMPV